MGRGQDGCRRTRGRGEGRAGRGSEPGSWPAGPLAPWSPGRPSPVGKVKANEVLCQETVSEKDYLFNFCNDFFVSMEISV